MVLDSKKFIEQRGGVLWYIVDRKDNVSDPLVDAILKMLEIIPPETINWTYGKASDNLDCSLEYEMSDVILKFKYNNFLESENFEIRVNRTSIFLMEKGRWFTTSRFAGFDTIKESLAKIKNGIKDSRVKIAKTVINDFVEHIKQ